MLAKILFRGGWGAMFFGSAFLCGLTFVWYIMGYSSTEGWVFFRTNVGFLQEKQAFVRDAVWMTAFYVHVASCIICLLAGAFQFLGYIRSKYPHFHRTLGKLYLFSVFVGGFPSGLYMSIFANGGLPAQIGFIILSMLWLVATYFSYTSIREGDIKNHMAWTARSYALTFSAVTLRFWTMFLSLYTEIPKETIVIFAPWLNWIPNLLITELIIRYARRRL